MQIRPALMTLAAATAAALLPLGAANAQTYKHFDATHDVQSTDLNDTSDQMPVLTPDPTRKDPDIKSIRVHYGARALSVRVHFRDLHRNPEAINVYGVPIRTSEHTRREVDIFAGMGDWKGEAMFGGVRTCKGLHHHISYRLDDVLVRVPSTCLGSPRWVKVAGMTVKEVFDLSPNADENAPVPAYLDDALSAKIDFRHLHWTPRLHRG